MKKFRKVSIFIVFVLLLNMLSGCAQDVDDPVEINESQNGDLEPSDEISSVRDTLVVAITSEPPSVAAIEHDSLISAMLNILSYNGLMRVDDETLEVVPDLASDYWVENETDWYFELRENVKFHNGDLMTSADVVASLEHAKSLPETAQYTASMKTIEAIDEYTVKIVTDGPYAGLLFDLTFHFNMILPKSLIESENDFNENPIGTGPYVLKSWDLGDRLTYEAFDDFFDSEHMPQIKNVVFKIIPEGASRTIALEAGEIDFIWDVNPSDVQNLENNEEIEVVEIASLDNVIMLINNDVAPFDDPNLRNAIAYAVNRQDIVDAALNGFGTPNASGISQGFWGSTTENAPEFNLEKAEEYLSKWGGDPSSVKLPILCSNELRVSIATVMQSNLSKIGIEVEVVPLDTAAYFNKWTSGDYTALICSWSPATSLAYVLRYHSDRRASYPGCINDPYIDELVDKAKSTIDDDERLKIIHEIVSEINLASPQLSLYQSTWYRAHDKDLDGVICSGIGYTSFHKMFWKN